MENELLINGKDAYGTWGVRIGEGFLDTLFEPLQFKDFVENESRMQNGKRLSPDNRRFQSRELTLVFTVQGNGRVDFQKKKNAFFTELYAGEMELSIPPVSDEVFRLTYTGNGISYKMNTKRTFCQISAKFIEQNPCNRKTEANADA